MGETYVWKTLGGAVRSITNIYSLGRTESQSARGWGTAAPSVPLPHTYILSLIALWRAGRGLKGEGPKIYDLYSTLNHQAGEFFFNSHHLHSE